MTTVTIFVTKKCNYLCGNEIYGCAAGCQRHGADTITEPDFDKCIAWVGEHAPKCDVHITGGEPFLRDDIEYLINELLDAGHEISIQTNGSLIRENLWAVELPIKWLVTHHPQFVDIETFLQQIDPIKNSPHVVCRIMDSKSEPDEQIASLYSDFNFRWRLANEGFGGFDAKKHKTKKCDELVMIGQDGQIHPCSIPFKNIGHIDDLSYFPEKRDFRCDKIDRGTCGTAQTAQIMEALNEN